MGSPRREVTTPAREGARGTARWSIRDRIGEARAATTIATPERADDANRPRARARTDAHGVDREIERDMARDASRGALIVTAWYAANIGVLLLNKYILSVYGFKFPVFMTLCHMCMCSVLSATAREFKIVPKQFIRTRRHYGKVAVLAMTFALSVLGGNVSLRYIPVSFNQALGATIPFFTAIFAYLW